MEILCTFTVSLFTDENMKHLTQILKEVEQERVQSCWQRPHYVLCDYTFCYQRVIV